MAELLQNCNGLTAHGNDFYRATHDCCWAEMLLHSRLEKLLFLFGRSRGHRPRMQLLPYHICIFFLVLQRLEVCGHG